MADFYENDDVRIAAVRLGPWETNCYTVTCRHTADSLVVDAPGDVDAVMGPLESTTPRYLLLTHDHPDHVLALRELRERLGVPLAAHEADASELEIKPDRLLRDGETLRLGKTSLTVLHTPGHTPGSVCFSLPGFLLAGDTIFPGGPGKTFHPDGFRDIISSIKGKIFTLPDDTLILPGHGGTITVADARKEYQAFAARPHREDLYGDVLWSTA